MSQRLVAKMMDDEGETVPVSKLLTELREALLIWIEETAMDLNSISWFNTIRSSYRLISKLCNAIMYEADDASDDHKIKADQIFQRLGYDFAWIGSDLPPKAEAIITLLPQTEEDNIENLLTEEDIIKPEANKDNMKMHQLTEEDRPTQLPPQKMEEVPELYLPQEVAKRQIQPKTVTTTLFPPQEIAPTQFLHTEANNSHQHMLQKDNIDTVLPQELITTLDQCEVVPDALLLSA